MFHVIPISPIPLRLRENLIVKEPTNVELDVHAIAICFTEGEIPRVTVIDTSCNGMYHDIDFTQLGLHSVSNYHDKLNSHKRICPPDKPVITNYLEHVQNKQVCVFTQDRKFLCHGTYHISFEWASEIWHMVSTQGRGLLIFHPTHKLLWLSTHESGACRNEHILPDWEKQRSYYNGI